MENVISEGLRNLGLFIKHCWDNRIEEDGWMWEIWTKVG